MSMSLEMYQSIYGNPTLFWIRGIFVFIVLMCIYYLPKIIYHGSDKKRCWREPDCLVCYTKHIICIIKLVWRDRDVKWESTE